MKDVRKSARLRAPKNTGGLKDSINVRQEKEGLWILEVESPHGVFQEEGFKPHWIHRSMIAGQEGESGFVFVTKNKPFVTPALEHNLSKLSQRLSNATDIALGAK